jgi:hypothetical protein
MRLQRKKIAGDWRKRPLLLMLLEWLQLGRSKKDGTRLLAKSMSVLQRCKLSMEWQILVRTRNNHVLMRISGREWKSKLHGRATVFTQPKILTSFQRWKKGICGVNMAWGCWNQTVVVVAMR